MFERYLILLGCTDDFCLIVIHFSVVHCSRTSELISLFLLLFQISSLRFIFLINQDLINVIRTESQKLVPTWHKEGDRQRHTEMYGGWDVRRLIEMYGGMRRMEITDWHVTVRVYNVQSRTKDAGDAESPVIVNTLY